MDTAFYLILNMSITGTVIGLLLLVLKRIKILPAFGSYLLWGLAGIRLIVPFSFSSPLSLFNYTGNLIKRVITVPTGEPSMDLTLTNAIGAARNYFPVSYQSERLNRIFSIAALIWVILAAAGLIAASILYALTRNALQKARPVSGGLFESDLISSPMICGIVRPRIIVPSQLSMDKSALDHILLHERVHLKRCDNLWRLIAVGIACLHWFNPLVWVFLKAFFEDMELSCDARAVKALKSSERKAYARTLLQFGTGQRLLMSTAFGGSKMRVRIQNVISCRKLTLSAMIFTSIFIAAVSIVLLTNPLK